MIRAGRGVARFIAALGRGPGKSPKPGEVSPEAFMRWQPAARLAFLRDSTQRGHPEFIDRVADAVFAGGTAEEVLQVANAVTRPDQALRGLERLKQRVSPPGERLPQLHGAATVLARKSESWPELLLFARRALRHEPSRIAMLRDVALALRKMRYVRRIDRLVRHLDWRHRTGRLALTDYVEALRAMQYRRALAGVQDDVEAAADRRARVAYVNAMTELSRLDVAGELAARWRIEVSELASENADTLRHFQSRQKEFGVRSFDEVVDAILDRLRAKAAAAALLARPQRVLVFASSLGIGGGERQLIHLLEYLSEASARYQVTLVVTFRRREFKLPDGLRGIRIVYRDEMKPEPAAQQGLTDAQRSDIEMILRRPRFEPLARFVREFRPDIVYHAVGLPTDALLVGLLAGARTVVRFGGLDLKTNYDATDLQVINAHVAERCCAHLAQSVTFVANSKVARQVWAERFGAGHDRFTVIPNGVDFAPLLEASARQTLKAGLFGRADAVVVGFVGRFQNVKRLDVWTDVALELARRDPRVRFLLAGDGPLAPRIKEKVEATEFRDRFRFTGAVLSGLSDLYQAMDALLHTSWTESLPNAVIEAVGHGTFAVAAPVGDVADIIDAPYSGALVAANDLPGFVEHMSDALSRTDALESDRERRAARIRRTFATRRMWAGYVRAFRGKRGS